MIQQFIIIEIIARFHDRSNIFVSLRASKLLIV